MDIQQFIERWRRNEGGAERANFPLFLTELAQVLGLPQPDPADAAREHNDYVFERAVTFADIDGAGRRGRIDLYKRGCFVMEAKQSRQPGGAKEVASVAEQDALPGLASEAVRGRRSAHRGWDVLLRNAREQAEQYARALPAAHGWPPFILVCDVGHAIEVFADFSGQGKNYRQFPDRAGFRIYLDDLVDATVQARLRAIWLDPHSLDPAKHAAAVTRDIARRLAHVSRLLEARGHAAEPVAHFLMRCLFTMFAEDSGLLDRAAFKSLLEDAIAMPDNFAPLLEDLWRAMDSGGFSPVLRRKVRHFNGGLFADRRAIALEREEIGELLEAARHDWKDVEPAIFGTLLEQALDKDERRRLGAHYTPRAYVERLVSATVIEPLKVEWEGAVLGTVEREREADPAAAVRAVREFHRKLATTRVLDPACGTGNFLYVALELLKRLEGEVLEVLADLGGQEMLQLETETVHPRNFLGLELNPRAAAIAELVLWLGYLQWQLRNGAVVSDPVLEKLSNIRVMDAVLDLELQQRPDWPEADYIVGNPPFIGKGAALRWALGDTYVEALWKAHPKINKSADFVMYWWDRAAERLVEKGTQLKRFGFVTTNSITQEFNRRLVARRTRGRTPVSLVMAVPDHPWTRMTKDAAAVRIAMTVAAAGKRRGWLLEVERQAGLDSDTPSLDFRITEGVINPDLTIGADVTAARPLKATLGLAYNGMMLAARGFLLTQAEASHLRAELGEGAGIVRPYLGGAALVQRRTPQFVIDTADLGHEALRRGWPAAYQRLSVTVKSERAARRDAGFRDQWWRFGRIRPDLRAALRDIRRYIATTETTKHRTFQFVDAQIVPDHMIVSIALDDGFHLGVLSSRVHVEWSLRAGGWLGVGNDPRYSKSRTFDPFPFPDATGHQRATIAALAEELDATRKEVLAAHHDLTLTGLYNLREKLRAGVTFDLVEQDQRSRGRVDILAELHGAIDDAVADAYGWPRELSDEAIVARLVVLNAERRREERAGQVRWLRPDYQIARAGLAQVAAAEEEQLEVLLPDQAARKPIFPRDAIGQTAAVLDDLLGGRALTAETIAQRYQQGRRVEPRIEATLQALTRLGHVQRGEGGFCLRRAA